MAKQIIKGDDLMLFDSTGKSIGYATAHTLTITGETTDTTSKDHGIWKGNALSKMSWEMTSENLYTNEEYDALFDAMVARKPITLYFGIKTDPTDEEDTVVDDDYNAWSLAPKENVAKAETASVGEYDETGTITSATYGYYGKAYLTSLTANANTGENATFSVTFTGSGKIKKVGE